VKAPGRALATLAVGFLALDAILLVIAGVATGRGAFFLGAGACALAGVLVVLVWRRFRRALADLEDARRQMRADVEAIRDLLHSHHLNN
jgi:hypothetical protein